LNKEFLESLYRNICRSLFEEHKLLFSALLTIKLMDFNGELNNEEFRFLLTGGVALTVEMPKCPCDWLSEKLWGEMYRLDKIPAFNGWLNHFT
jgi:dynein heavy chain